MSDLKEYVVTLKKYEDLENFYNDMETPGGDLYIPDRSVEVFNRREASRNTHYMLTDSEAELLRHDTRVLSVTLTPSQMGMKPRRLWTQTSSNWNKSSTNVNTHNNWGLYNTISDEKTLYWGSDGNSNISGTISTEYNGKNVDVIIVDGHINPDHPEYALNNDGTGGSRVNQYNWFQHNATVWAGNPSNTYVYTPYVDGGDPDLTDDNNHGAHVAGTVAGNTQGWARQSTIYNISPYATNPNTFDALYIFDYIRAFHSSKTINTTTGIKNPTISNNSWGYVYQILITSLTSIVHRGVTVVSGQPTVNQLKQYGIDTDGTYVYLTSRYEPLEQDIQDAIDDGIIVVGAASNDSTKIDVYGGIDYDNYITTSTTTYYYHRGSTPGAAPNVICVGSISSNVAEQKSSFSNAGPRVNIFAPGSNIISSFNSNTSYGGVTDSRNNNFYLGKISGTSMASPQVTGFIACLLELYPNMTQSEALEYIKLNSKKDYSGADPYWEYVSLLLSMNGEHASTVITDMSSSTNSVSNTNSIAITTTVTATGAGSAYFDGTKVLTVSNNDTINIDTDNFTMEFWLLIPSGATRAVGILNKGSWPIGSGSSYLVYFGSGGELTFYFSHNATSWAGNVSMYSFASDDGLWHHYAIVRENKATIKTYRDGTLIGNSNVATNLNTVSNDLYIGSGNLGSNKATCYIEGLRFTKNVARYTENFTPSNLPFSASDLRVSDDPYFNNVSLYLKMNGINGSTNFVDSSLNKLSVTRNGSPVISSDQQQYGVSSAYFNTNDDYLIVSDNSVFDLHTDFTVEAWVYFTNTVPTDMGLCSGSSAGSFDFAFVGNEMRLGRINTSWDSSATFVRSSNVWYHVSWCKSGNTLNFFVNGQIVGTVNNTNTYEIISGGNLIIGHSGTGNERPFKGYISNLIITKGIARYTTDFIPPDYRVNYLIRNEGDLYFDKVSLLLKMNGYNNSTNFVDSSLNNLTITRNGNAAISTTQSKFGGSSAYFDGNTDWLAIDSNELFDIFSGDFTIEFFVFFSDVTNNQCLIQIGINDANRANVTIVSNLITVFTIVSNGGGLRVSAPAPAINTWHHVAWVKLSNTTSLYVNGISVGNPSISTPYPSGPMSVGIGGDQVNSGINVLNGYIDDLRVTKGVARYTSNFTSPGSHPIKHQDRGIYARYWRIKNITVLNGGGSGGYLEISELQFIGDTGRLTGTMTSSVPPSFGGIDVLNDNNLGTRCYWNESDAEASSFWIKIDLGIPGLVVGIKQGGYDTPTRCIGAFTLEYSNDDLNWYSLISKDNITYPGNQTLSSLYQCQSNSPTDFFYRDFSDLQGAPNNILSYKKEKIEVGNTYPKLNQKARPIAGQVYPRTIRKLLPPIYKTIFTYTGYEQHFTVPDNINSLTFRMWGAGGAGGSRQPISAFDAASGGNAGYVSGTVSVTPGENLGIVVGQGGRQNNTGTSNPRSYGGGGLGWGGGNQNGGGGGGLSALYRGDLYYPYVAVLLHMNGTNGSTTFTDSSNNALTLTGISSPTISTAQSKFGGSSLLLNGSNQYVKLDPLSFFYFEDSPFTVEAWIYPTTIAPKNRYIFTISENLVGSFAYFYVGLLADGRITAYVQPTTAEGISVNSGATTVSINQWTHVAFVRNGVNATLYINGVNVGSASNWVTYPNAKVQHVAVGAVANGYSDSSIGRFEGYIDDVRVTKNTARYAASFTPPTAEFPDPQDQYFDNVSLLLHMNGENNATTFIDSSLNNLSITRNGDAVISTTESKFGGASAYFDGNGDYLDVAASTGLAFGTGDFTVEFWYYSLSTPSQSPYRRIIAHPSSTNAANTFQIWHAGDSANGTPTAAVAIALPDGTETIISTVDPVTSLSWFHIAFTRSSGTLKCFLNGVLKQTVSGNTTNFTLGGTEGLRIGSRGDLSIPSFLHGYIDELRITKGLARYTENFNSPNRQFADSNGFIAIAAGGGGGASTNQTAVGGSGGGLSGNDGITFAGSAGLGGSQISGGAAGSGGSPTSGSKFSGGDGSGADGSGGGGGGGYYGGGGGGGTGSGGSGGGGGSSYIASTVTNEVTITGGNQIDYDRGTAGLGGQQRSTGENGIVIVYYSK